jgi:hypothetical protein
MGRHLRLTAPDRPDAAELLRAARALIQDPAHFTQRTLARDAAGRSALPWEDEAVAFAVYGALVRSAYDLLPGEAVYSVAFQTAAHFVRSAAVERGRMHWVAVNDQLGHEAVLAIVDRAIEWAVGDPAAAPALQVLALEPRRSND